MEKLRNIGQICRQHYEKLLLTAGLLILAGAVLFLRSASVAEREKIREIPEALKGKKVKPVQPVNMAGFNAALKQVETPAVLDLSREHLLFNPVPWQSRGGGSAEKIKSNDQIGPRAMTVTKIDPLNMVIAYGSASLSGNPPDVVVTGYWMFTTNELFASGSKRLLKSFMSPGTNNLPVPFWIREVKGEPKEPTEVLAEMKDDGEKFSFAPGKPFSRVLGHEADMTYKPSGRKYNNVRKGATIDIDGQPYKIVDILPNKVVLSDDSNGKQYSITGVPQQ